MMADDGNVDESVKKMEKEEEDMKKVECLRGRLIAERASSKLAKQEAQEMECKVGELEIQLKSETKLRKRAHKKLNFLLNKLHSLKIPYLSKDLENSDMYSDLSSISSALTQIQEKEPKVLIKTHENGEKEDHVSHIPTSNQSSTEPTGFESYQNCNNANIDNQSFCSLRDAVEGNKDIRGKSNEAAQRNYVSGPLALVLIDLPKEPPQVNIDPLILDTNVKQALDALNHAKQRLLLSMERRHMTRIGSK